MIFRPEHAENISSAVKSNILSLFLIYLQKKYQRG